MVTPQVGASRQLSAPIEAKATTVGPRANSLPAPTQRSIRNAPRRACKVEPTAMSAATAKPRELTSARVTVSASQELTMNEPAQTPDQTRGPHHRRPARAMPDGGHTAVA